MKKTSIKLLFITFIITFFQIFIFNINVYASIASISTSGSVNVGSNFTITLNIPANATAAEANILVKYANGSTKSTKIAYVEGMNGFNSKSVSFNAEVAGTATISATNIIISDADGNALENGGTASTSIQINSPAPVEPETPSQPDDSASPNTPTAPSTPNTNQTPKEPNFKATNDTVYATKSMNVRSSWSKSSSKVGGLSEGQAVTRTGIGDNGWSRINYNGGTAYVSTALITTTKPEPKPVEPEPIEEEKTEEKTEEMNSDEKIDEVPEENLEKTEEQIYQEIVSNIGTIPEVGTNENIYIYVILIIFSIISVFVLLKK